jgi:2-oxoglutarate ferredoxin oxidoreductase subunit delta
MTTDTIIRKGRGTVAVQSRVCKGCSFCIDFCPSKCLAFSQDFNAKGYHYPVLFKPEDCSGCNLCGMYCPDFAIFGAKYQDLDKRRAERVTEVLAA